MSSLDDDECMIKLDANIDVETIVRNRFEDVEDTSQDESFRSHSASSEEDRGSDESTATGDGEGKDLDNTAGSDVSDYPSVVSDDSSDSTRTSVPRDVPEQCTPSTSKAETINTAELRLKDVSCKELIVSAKCVYYVS